jgi:hypothetical protein
MPKSEALVPITDSTEYMNAFSDVIAGVKLPTIRKRHPAISMQELKFLQRLTVMTGDRFDEFTKETLKVAEAKLIQRLLVTIDEINPNFIPKNIGIIHDKLQVLQGKPTNITSHETLKVGDGKPLSNDDLSKVLESGIIDVEVTAIEKS